MSITVKYNDIEISPSPKISFQSDISYANDNNIGYKYNITLNGIAIADQNTFDTTIEKINNIKNLLSNNSSILEVINDTNSEVLLKATGGILKNFTINNTDNSWSKYASYTATLTFNEINILSDSYDCNDSSIQNSVDQNLVNVNKYKINQFKDGWNISLTDNIFNYYDHEPEQSGDALSFFYNTQIEVKYEISATGETYFNNDKTSIPSWQQAKHFVQDRLYNQITDFYNSYNILNTYGDTSCNSSKNLSNIHTNDGSGIIDSSIKYSIFNETITCATSESDGNFSATYSAILKYNDDNDKSFGTSNSIHNFTKAVNTSREGDKNNTSIRIEGNIQGLNNHANIVFGGFSLPNNGRLLTSGTNFNKMANALTGLSKIIDENNNDLQLPFKSGLDISASGLNFTSCSESIPLESIQPASFSLTKNNFLGTINYSIEYNTDRIGVSGDGTRFIYNTSIDIDNPIPVYAELPVPNGDYIIQDLKTKTAKKFTISIIGRDNDRSCCFTNMNKEYILGVLDSFTFPNPPDSIIITNKNISYNLMTGSFNINAAFICEVGCEI